MLRNQQCQWNALNILLLSAKYISQYITLKEIPTYKWSKQTENKKQFQISIKLASMNYYYFYWSSLRDEFETLSSHEHSDQIKKPKSEQNENKHNSSRLQTLREKYITLALSILN